MVKNTIPDTLGITKKRASELINFLIDSIKNENGNFEKVFLNLYKDAKTFTENEEIFLYINLGQMQMEIKFLVNEEKATMAAHFLFAKIGGLI